MSLKQSFIFFIFVLPFSILLNAQQPQSPLTASFQSYLEMKQNTPFHFEWISLGPVVNSARVEAVQVDPQNPSIMYAAFGSGNLWKTTNHGNTWKPIFEDQPALGIGDIALAPSNPNIIYVGTGESLKKPRNFTMPGNGVYRSDDGGENWKHLGLDDSWHIGEIAVHPYNPDYVLVAVLGHFWSTNSNRGLYLTKNGGKSWDQVLYIDEKTGANDVVFSASNPNIVYASMWENNPEVSGPNSGIYRSDDGGETWEKVMNGISPKPQIGRIGLAVSYQNPDKVYALVDNLNNPKNETAEVYQSLDGGKKWERTHKEKLMIFPGIGWYFADMYVNPTNDDEIYGLGVRMAHSKDGGETFDLVGGNVNHVTPSAAEGLHLDHCELWISPLNPNHLVLGNDGGLYVSYDRGGNWTHYNNIPAGEFYDITTDYQKPYNIYGGTQDDATVFGPAKEWNPRFEDPWKYLWIDSWYGGDGCFTIVDPEDSNTVYFSMQHGAVQRKNLALDKSKFIGPRLPKRHKKKLKTNFITPYILSPHNSKTLYLAGNYVFRSTNRGDSWIVISDDLSHSSNPEKESEAAGAIQESHLQAGLLYMGTDRGGFWASENGGVSWDEHSEGLPNHYIRSIYPSKHKIGRVYVAMNGMNYDNLDNHLYKSEDHGKTWESISGNLPNETANVILEDPMYENVLYAGLYRGIYISLDKGESWALMGDNLAATCVADLEIKEEYRDLIMATHGRGIYKLNLSPLYEFFEEGFDQESDYLFKTSTAYLPKIHDTHRNPNYKTVEKTPISFWLSDTSQCVLSISHKGKTIWEKELEGKKGLNQFRWDLVTEIRQSDLPYFIHYERFIRSGEYKLKLSEAKSSRKLKGKLETTIEVKPWIDKP